MIWKGFSLTAVCALALFTPSCAHDRELVDITIHPGGATLPTPDPSAQVIFSALGGFVHPPETKDMTNQVTWKTDIPQLITVNTRVESATVLGCNIRHYFASTDRATSRSGNLGTVYATL